MALDHATTIEAYSDPQVAQRYARDYSLFWRDFPNEIFTDFAEGIPQGSEVLNVGSGPGYESERLRELGLRVVCFDASAPMLEMTRERGFESIQGDFMNFPDFGRRFAGIWAFTSIGTHLPHRMLPHVLRQIRGFTTGDAVLAVGVLQSRARGRRKVGGISRTYGDERLISYYTEGEILDILSRCAYEPQATYQHDYFGHQYLTAIANKF
ncbi:class I SAM-dependent methyltransferase [Candidatus Daviesbacteria bacterium]|nr:class I SAM-dependent methyltransferase [Candidatus Daviesbacteria bacterium]